MTTAEDRDVLRAWRDRHTNVQPARGSQVCVHAVWLDGEYAGDCGRPAEWSSFERGEVPA